MHPTPVSMPWAVLRYAEQFAMAHPLFTSMPAPVLDSTEQCEIVEPLLARMPRCPLNEEVQPVTLAEILAVMPVPVLPDVTTPSTRQPRERNPRSTPPSPQFRTEPSRTVMPRSESTVTLTPSKAPMPGTPTRSNPLRSSVTPLETISIPCLPTTPVILPVR